MAKRTILDYLTGQGAGDSKEADNAGLGSSDEPYSVLRHQNENFSSNIRKSNEMPTEGPAGATLSSSDMVSSLPCGGSLNDAEKEDTSNGGGLSKDAKVRLAKQGVTSEECKKRMCVAPTPGALCLGADVGLGKGGAREDVQLPSNVAEGAQCHAATVCNDINVYDNAFLSSNISASSDARYSFLEDDSPSSSKKDESRYPFMLEVRDKNGVPEGAEGYDPTTLYIPDSCYKKFTPFERQFWDIKKKHFDVVIMFKKGAFYELYERDAEIAARLFDFRTTGRVNMKMAGFPEKNYDTWASKLLEHGYKIGRVEQAENSIGKKIREKNGERGEKIIARDLKEIITAGTIYSSDQINSVQPFYIAAIVKGMVSGTGASERTQFSVLLYDASINRIYLKDVSDRPDLSNLKGLLVQNDVREIISDADLRSVTRLKPIRPDQTPIVSDRKYEFQSDGAFKCYMYLHNYMALLCRESALKNACISALETPESFSLDGGSLTNLDILCNNYDGTDTRSLYKTINYCTTPFGKRLLKRWLINPLTNVDKILARRNRAAIFGASSTAPLIEALQQIGDAERYVGRLSNSNPSFKDLLSFVRSMGACKAFLRVLEEFAVGVDDGMINGAVIASHIGSVGDFLESFGAGYTVEEGEVKPGCRNDELARLMQRRSEIEASIKKYLEDLKKKQGLDGLVYKSINKDLFQVEAAAGVKLPPEFYVVSSTKTYRRYYSPALKELVTDLQETEERIFQAKGNLFRKALEFTFPYRTSIYGIINFVAEVDCYISFALFNTGSDACAPEFVDASEGLAVNGCRSPIFPCFVKNDFKPGHRVTLITGPNMGGKSTFLRSICLNIILAQVGMNVTCAKLRMPVFNQVFTRIGASDSLARGESTFMVELNEASRIMRHATEKSFVIMDELGRGTSTQDGNAIARAVLDYLKSVGCYTLFSTHYHSLVARYEGVDKAYVDCVIDDGDIVFLYKVREGVCLDSHGLYVARMARVPEEVIQRANAIRGHILAQKGSK